MSPEVPTDDCLWSRGESTRGRVVKGYDRVSGRRGSGDTYAVGGFAVRRRSGGRQGRVARVRAASVQPARPACGDAGLALPPIQVKILGREIAAELGSSRSALSLANPQDPLKMLGKMPCRPLWYEVSLWVLDLWTGRLFMSLMRLRT